MLQHRAPGPPQGSSHQHVRTPPRLTLESHLTSAPPLNMGRNQAFPSPAGTPPRIWGEGRGRAKSGGSKPSFVPTCYASTGSPDSLCLSLPICRKVSGLNNSKGYPHTATLRISATQLSGSGPQRLKAQLWARQPGSPPSSHTHHLQVPSQATPPLFSEPQFFSSKMGLRGRFSEAVQEKC